MLSSMIRTVLAPVAVLALTACGSDTADAPPQQEQVGARGEVLGGTITDAMIPLDTVTSQSAPLVAETPDNAETTPASSDRPAPDQEAQPAQPPDAEPAQAEPAE